MKEIAFYLDFISPYSYLAFERLPDALMGHSYSVSYRPILFAALLKHHGQLGPAEMPGKRDWTYRQVLWLAQLHGVDLQMPESHPFNPLALLRMALAAQTGAEPNRYVCETIFRHVWQGGAEAVDAVRLRMLAQRLNLQRDPQGADVKEQLKVSTDAAIASGVFGVPTLCVDNKLFWGFDALPMLRAYLEGDAWFGQTWEQAAHVAAGVSR